MGRALTLFKWVIMAFSASMTVFSLYAAFEGGTIGWIFGVAGIFIFEGAAMYWQEAANRGREGQIAVATAALWSTMTLSLLSTIVGIALLTEWGAVLRDNLPLGAIMIALVGSGLAVNMYGFPAFESEEPEAKRLHMTRMLAANKANMIHSGQVRSLASANTEMESQMETESVVLGRAMAKDGIAQVRERSTPAQLPAPRQSSPVSAQPWQVMNPATFAMNGKSSPTASPYARRRPVMGHPNMPRPTRAPVEDDQEDLPHPSAYGEAAHDVDVQHAPLAPKASPRVTGTMYNAETGQPMVRPVPTPAEFQKRMNE